MNPRTCIGCRQRAASIELFRVVADVDSQPDLGKPVQVVPDPRRRAPGRGAWLHPSPDCVTLAERRRAFGRALRLQRSVDSTPVREYVESLATSRPASAGRVVGETHESETKSYEHPMKRQQ